MSGIAGALDALQARVRASLDAAGLTDVQVFDGPAPNREQAAFAVTLGAPFDDDQDAVTVSREERGANLRVVDSVEVACSVYVGTGDIDFDVHRAKAGAILGAVAGGIASDRQLGGTVALARMGAEQWMQALNEFGAGVVVGFIVTLRFLP